MTGVSNCCKKTGLPQGKVRLFAYRQTPGRNKGERPGGKMPTSRCRKPCRGRCLHRPGNPASPQGPREGHGPPLQTGGDAQPPGRPRPRVITNLCRGRFHIGPARGGTGPCGRDALIPPDPAAEQGPAGGMNPAPTNGGKARGQPEKCEPRDATNLCRGRCLHRPGDPAPPQGPREGHGPPLRPRQTPGSPATRNLRGTPHIPPQTLNIFPSRPQGGGPPHLNS